MTSKEILNAKKLFQKPSVKLTAILKAASIDQVAEKHHRPLTLVPEESHYKWHADISNWPEEKALRVTIAKELVLCVEECIPEE